MQWMIVAHKDTSVITDLLEGDRIAIKSHLMATCIVVEPEVIKTVSCCLTFVSGVAYL